MHGVSDRVGSTNTSRWRCSRCGLPQLLQRRHPKRTISRLDGRPARAPVNAWDRSSRTGPHDSGSRWVATPSSYGSFIRYVSSASPGASAGRRLLAARLATRKPAGAPSHAARNGARTPGSALVASTRGLPKDGLSTAAGAPPFTATHSKASLRVGTGAGWAER